MPKSSPLTVLPLLLVWKMAKKAGCKVIFGLDAHAPTDITNQNNDAGYKLAKELGLEPHECIIFEDSGSGVQAALSAGASIVVAVMEECQRNCLEGLVYDKNKTKLIILDSMDQFDFSIIKSIDN